MYLLQLTKRIYSPKNQQSKQLLFRNPSPKTCRADAENSPKENPAPEIGWPRNFLHHLSCFGPIHERSSQRSGHRLIKQVKFRRASAMMEKYRRDYQFFTTLCLRFGIVSMQVDDVSVQRQLVRLKEKKKKKGSPGSLISWKLICDLLMKSSSFGIKLNVQRYLSVGISLIALREVSDRLMQVLTWASPRILSMYPATDRYC